MNKDSFRFIWKVVIAFNLILLFIIIGLIVLGNIDIKIKAWENGWSGFAGGVVGGILTLTGVIITINYYKHSDSISYRRNKLLNKPFLGISILSEDEIIADPEVDHVVEKEFDYHKNTNDTKKIIIRIENTSNAIARKITFQHYIYQEYKKIDFAEYTKKFNYDKAPVVRRYLKGGDCFYLMLNFKFDNGKDISGAFKLGFCDYEGEKIREPILLFVEYAAEKKEWSSRVYSTD